MLRRCLLLILILFSFNSFAEDSSFAVLDKFRQSVHTGKLSNGIRVIIYNRPVAPVFAGYISVKVGGVDEPERQTGIAHMLEHMAFKGSSRIGSKNYEQEKVLLDKLEKLMIKQSAGEALNAEQEQELLQINQELEGVWDQDLTLDKVYESLGGLDANATTSADTTNYFLNLPVNAFEIWAEIEAERILDPVYRQFYKERDVVIEERRMRTDDDPEGKLYEQMLQHAFQLHPYRNPVIGYPQDISALTATQTLAFQKQFYVPDNILIVLVGDLKAADVLPVLEKNFGKISGQAVPAIKASEPAQAEERRFKLYFDSKPQQIIAYHKPNYPNREDVPLTVFFEYLLGGNNSLLIKDLVIDRKLAFGIDYGEGPGGRYPNLYYIHAIPKDQISNARLLTEIDRIINKALREPLDSGKIEIIKRQLLVSSLSGLKSNMGLASQLAYAEHIFGNWQEMLNWYEILRDLSPQEIQRIAGEYLRTSNRTVGFLETKSK